MVEQIRQRISTMFSDLNFDDRRHLYYVQGVMHPSVSSMIDLHTEKVDFEKILPYSAIKAGCSVDELRGRWKKTNKDACEMGTETHDFLEIYDGLQTPTSPQQKAGIKFLKDIIVDYEIVFRELRMYSRRYQIAGTTDLLLRHKKTGQLVLADYKTNADLFKNYKGKTLLAPFDDLEEHPYNKYQVQLSYYDLMLEEIKYHVSERLLVYLRPDADYRIFPTIDFKDRLHTYLTNKKVIHDNVW